MNTIIDSPVLSVRFEFLKLFFAIVLIVENGLWALKFKVCSHYSNSATTTPVSINREYNLFSLNVSGEEENWTLDPLFGT